MSQSNEGVIVAGTVSATCACCVQARALVNHVRLGPARMLCAETGSVHIDRGDGIYRVDPTASVPLTPPVAQAVTISARATPTVAELLDDRPVRSGEKTRIRLENATFA